jgi:hypothetical protein
VGSTCHSFPHSTPLVIPTPFASSASAGHCHSPTLWPLRHGQAAQAGEPVAAMAPLRSAHTRRHPPPPPAHCPPSPPRARVCSWSCFPPPNGPAPDGTRRIPSSLRSSGRRSSHPAAPHVDLGQRNPWQPAQLPVSAALRRLAQLPGGPALGGAPRRFRPVPPRRPAQLPQPCPRRRPAQIPDGGASCGYSYEFDGHCMCSNEYLLIIFF